MEHKFLDSESPTCHQYVTKLTGEVVFPRVLGDEYYEIIAVIFFDLLGQSMSLRELIWVFVCHKLFYVARDCQISIIDCVLSEVSCVIFVNCYIAYLSGIEKDGNVDQLC